MGPSRGRTLWERALREGGGERRGRRGERATLQHAVTVMYSMLLIRKGAEEKEASEQIAILDVEE